MKSQRRGIRVVAFAAAASLGLVLSVAASASDFRNQFLPGVQKVFVTDTLGLGTGSDVSCFIPLPPPTGTASTFADCGASQGLIAIPNNDSKLFNGIMAAKVNSTPIWIMFDHSGPTYSCGLAIGSTQCSIITFSLQ